MNRLSAIFLFEFNRILTPGRAVWWLVVASFPVAITLLLQISLRNRPPNAPVDVIHNIYTFALYFMAASVSCMLGALLTAAPAVATELEQHSWVYFATRPNGLRHLVLGKYLVAVVFASTATISGLTVAIPLSEVTDKPQVWAALAAISVLSSAAYSAMYLLIGTLFHARAIVFCVAYTAGVEVFLGSFPAVINRLTVQYRLRSLLFQWALKTDRMRNTGIRELVASTDETWLQIAWILLFLCVFLVIALWTVRFREFTPAVESDV